MGGQAIVDGNSKLHLAEPHWVRVRQYLADFCGQKHCTAGRGYRFYLAGAGILRVFGLKGRMPFGTVVNQTALSANHVKAKFGFRQAATDHSQALADGESAAVLIATRHHMHGPLVKAALLANRHVFVEKPFCLTRAELDEIDAALLNSQDSLQVGFNRRFAPASAELKSRLLSSPGPKTATYRVLPGRLDTQHWYANYPESGGRVMGDVCHFLD